MQIFEIIDEKNGKYKLKQKNSIKKTELLIEFFGIDKPKIGWEILMDENLLDKTYEGYCQPYFFELYVKYTDEKTAPVISSEFIILHKNNKNYLMKRIYG